MNLVGHFVLLDVGLVLLLELGVGDLDGLAKLVDVQKRVTHSAPFRHLVFGFVFLVLRFDLGFRGVDLRFQILRLDERVIELHFFVFVAVAILEFLGPNADSVGYKLSEFFLEQALPDQLFKRGHGKLEALLDERRVLVHSNESGAIERHRQIHFYAVGALLVGNRDSQAPGFILNFSLKDELLQNLLCVKRFQLLRHLVRALDLTELLLDVLRGNRLVANLGDGVRGEPAAAGSRPLRNKVEQHAAAQSEDHRTQKDAVSQFAFVVCVSSHPMIPPGP